jgi:hypothetical protein
MDIFMPIMDGFAADAAGSALLNVARAQLVTGSSRPVAAAQRAKSGKVADSNE